MPEYDLGEAVLRIKTDTSGASAGIDSLGKSLTGLGKKMSATLSAPIGVFKAVVQKAAIDFESSFTGMTKTVDALTNAQGKLNDVGKATQKAFRELANTIPVDVNTLNKIGELGGQLGIVNKATKDVTGTLSSFADTIAKLDVATDMNAEQAATELARFYNITKSVIPSTVTAADNIEQLGSTIVALGNNLATTESEISNMAQRIAGAGVQAGLSQADIMGLAAAVSSVGIRAEAGGTALSRVLLNMRTSVAEAGDGLKIFARTAGVSTSQFAQAFQKDAAGSLLSFLRGLNQLEKSGQDTSGILKALKLDGLRVGDVLRRLSSNTELAANALEVARQGFADNNALQEEAARRFATTESQLKLLENSIHDVAITLGSAMLPGLNNMIGAIRPLTQQFGAFAEVHPTIMKVAMSFLTLVAAIGPALIIAGQLAIAWGAVGATLSTIAAPVAVVVGVIALLGVAWKKNLLGIQNVTQQVMGRLKALFSLGLSGAIKMAAGEAMVAFGHFLVGLANVADQILSFASLLAMAFKVGGLSAVAAIVEGQLKNIIDRVVAIASSIGQSIVVGIQAGFARLPEGLVSTIKQIASGFIDAIKRAFGISSPAAVAIPIGEYIALGILQGFQNALQFAKIDIAASFIVPLINSFVNQHETLHKFFGGIGGLIVGSIEDGLHPGDLAKTFAKLILSVVSGGAIVKFAQAGRWLAVAFVVAWQKDLLGIRQVTESILAGVITGLGSFGQMMLSAFVGAIQSAIAGIKHILGISSPAAATIPIGSSLAEGVAEGAVQGAKGLPSILTGAIGGAFGDLALLLKANLALAGAGIIGGIVNGLISHIPVIGKASEEIPAAIIDGIHSAMPGNALTKILSSLLSSAIGPSLIVKFFQQGNVLGAALVLAWQANLFHMKDITTAALGGVLGVIGKVLNVAAHEGLSGVISMVSSEAHSIASAMAAGLSQGVSGSGASLLGAFVSMVRKAIDGLKSFLGIGSPARMLADIIGVPMAQGIIWGFKSVSASALQFPMQGWIQRSLHGMPALLKIFTVAFGKLLDKSFVGLTNKLLGRFGKTLGSSGVTMAKALAYSLSTVFTSVLNVQVKLVSKAAGGILKVVGPILKKLAPLFLSLLSGPVGIIALIAAIVALAVAWSKNWHDIQGKASAAIPKITSAIEQLKTILTNAVTSLKSFVKGAVEAFKSGGLSGLASYLSDAIIGGIRTMISQIPHVIMGLARILAKAVNAVPWETIGKLVGRWLLTTFLGIISSVFYAIYVALRSGLAWAIIKAIGSFALGLAESVYDTVSVIIPGTIRGIIEGAAGWVRGLLEALIDLISRAIRGLMGWLGIASPAKRMIPIGEAMAQGIVVGLYSLLNKVAQFFESLLGITDGALQNIVSALQSGGIDGAIAEVARQFEALTGINLYALVDEIKTVYSIVSTALGNIGNIISSGLDAAKQAFARHDFSGAAQIIAQTLMSALSVAGTALAELSTLWLPEIRKGLALIAGDPTLVDAPMLTLAMAAVRSLGEHLASAMSSLKDKGKELLANAIGQPDLADGPASTLVKALLSKIGEHLSNGASELAGKGKELLANAIGQPDLADGPASALVKTLLSKIGEHLSSGASELTGKVKELLANAIGQPDLADEPVAVLVDAITSKIASRFIDSDLADKLRNALTSIFGTTDLSSVPALELVKRFVSHISDSLSDNVSEVATSVLNMISQSIENIDWPGVIKRLIGLMSIGPIILSTLLLALYKVITNEALQEAVNRLFNSIIGAISSVENSIIVGLSDAVWRPLKQAVEDTAVNLLEKAKSFGVAIVDGLKQGMIDKWDDFLGFLKKKFESIPGMAKILGLIGSPSPYFTEVGRAIPAGLSAGLQSGMPGAINTMRNFGNSLIDEGNNMMAGLQQAMTLSPSDIALQAIAGDIQTVGAAMADVADVAQGFTLDDILGPNGVDTGTKAAQAAKRLGRAVVSMVDPIELARKAVENFQGAIQGLQKIAGEDIPDIPAAVFQKIGEQLDRMLDEAQRLSGRFRLATGEINTNLIEAIGATINIFGKAATAFGAAITILVKFRNIASDFPVIGAEVFAAVADQMDTMINEMQILSRRFRLAGNVLDKNLLDAINATIDVANKAGEAFVNGATALLTLAKIATEFGGRFPHVDPQDVMVNLGLLIQGMINRMEEISRSLNIGLLPITSAVTEVVNKTVEALVNAAQGVADIFKVVKDDFEGTFPKVDPAYAFVNLRDIVLSMILRMGELAQTIDIGLLVVTDRFISTADKAIDLMGKAAQTFADIVAIVNDEAFGGMLPAVNPAYAFVNLRDIIHGMVLRMIELSQELDQELLTSANTTIESIAKGVSALSGVIEGLKNLVDFGAFEADITQMQVDAVAGAAFIIDLLKSVALAIEAMFHDPNATFPQVTEAAQSLLDNWSAGVSVLSGIIEDLGKVVDFGKIESDITQMQVDAVAGAAFIIDLLKSVALAIEAMFHDPNATFPQVTEAAQSLLDNWSAGASALSGIIEDLGKVIDFGKLESDITQMQADALAGAGRIVNVLHSIVTGIVQALSDSSTSAEPISESTQSLLDNWSAALSPLSSAADVITKIIDTDLTKFKDVMVTRLVAAMQNMATAIDTAMTQLESQSAGILDRLEAASKQLAPLGDAIGSVVDAITSVFNLGGLGRESRQTAPGGFHNQGYFQTFDTFAADFNAGIERLGSSLKEIANKVASLAGDQALTAAIASAGALQDDLGALQSSVESIASAISSITEIGMTEGGDFSAGLATMRSSLTAIANALSGQEVPAISIEWLTTAIASISNSIASVDWGSEIQGAVSGIANGIYAAMGGVDAAFGSLLADIQSWIAALNAAMQDIPQPSSPLPELANMIHGIDAAVPGATAAFDNLSAAVAAGADAVNAALSPPGGRVVPAPMGATAERNVTFNVTNNFPVASMPGTVTTELDRMAAKLNSMGV